MNKARRKRCKECNQLFKPTYTTTQVVCSPKCAYAYSRKKDEKLKEKNHKELKVLAKKRKERIGLSTLLESVKNLCHEYIRIRDKGKPCISCKTPYHKDFQAGHFYKAELFSSLKFHEFNINGQCVQCNIRLEGNLNDYALNLPKRIGKDIVNGLEVIAHKERQQGFKWDREELKRIRKYYRDKIKNLKRQV